MEKPAQTESDNPPPAARHASPVRVLYVDDYPLDRELVRDALEKEHGGFHVIEAKSRAEFEARLAEGDYDVVLSDFNILGFEGLQVIDAVRAKNPRVPVIIVTGTGSEEIAVEAMKRGAADYVIKTPKHIRRLPLVIHAALDKRRAEEERERVTEALRQSEARFRRLTENARDVIYRMSLPDGKYEYVSPAATQMFGYTPEEFYAEPILVRTLIHPDWHTYFQEQWAKLLSSDVPPTYEFQIIHKSGEVRWVNQRNLLIRDPDGRPAAIEGIITDITERKQRERELQAIANVSTALRVAQTRTQMLPIILDQLTVSLNTAGATFELLDPATGDVVIELGCGIWAAVTGDHIPPGKGLTAQVLATGESYLNNDARNDPRLFRPDLIGDCKAVAGAPLVAQERIIGLLWVARTSEIAEGDLRLLTAVADIAANAFHRATLHEQTERQVNRLATLHAIDLAISSSFDLRLTLDIILEHVTTQLRVDAAAVLLLNRQSNTLEFATGRGFRSSGITRLRLRLGEDYAGQAALERRLVSIPNLKKTERPFTKAPLTAGEDFTAYFGAPLIAKGQVKGVLEVFHRAAFHPDPDWLEFFDVLAGQAAIAIDNAELFNNLQRTNSELILSYNTTLEGWSRALDLRDKETEGHTQRVTEITLRLARALGMNAEELLHVRRGALLHDIGKMGVPDAILLKPGALTDEEWQVMRQHPEYAFNLLAPITYLRPALDIPYCHHEKWDGTGYPRGLQGEEIPLVARIFAVVDVWDAVRSDRPYRKAWSETQARQHIRSEAGTHFDPHMVEVFLKMDLGKV